MKRKIFKRVFSHLPTSSFESILEPSLTFINFDDIVFSEYNSIAISPNRYAGVAFYSPGAETWLTWSLRYSVPNSLITGVRSSYPDPSGVYPIISTSAIIVDFEVPAKDVTFLWGRNLSYYSSGSMEVYEGSNYQLVASFPVSLGSVWTSFSLNQYSQRIRRVILRRPIGNFPDGTGHIHLDNFEFTPVTTQQPVGNFDTVSIQQGAAVGWSVDPDNQSASNFVDCHVGSTFIGRTAANLPGPDVPYPGNHRFSLPIPIQYREGNQYSISCYGIDIAGGDGNTLLPGSPRTFRFNPPIGWNDLVNSDGEASGWSLDPDVPAQSNSVHFYVNGPAGGGGTYIGDTIAVSPL